MTLIDFHQICMTRIVFKGGFQEVDEECGDTVDLSMRFGIHSGSVAADVLR